MPAGSDVCHRGCAYISLQTVQRPVVCSAVDGSLLCTIKNPQRQSIGIGYSLDFGLPSVALSPGLCRKRRKALFTHFAIACHLRTIHKNCYNAIRHVPDEKVCKL